MRYVVVFEKTPNNYGAYVPDLPGCVAVGDTLEETTQMIREAIEFHIEGTIEDGEPIPAPSAVTAAVVEVDVPEGTRFVEPEYPLWKPELSEAAEIAD